MIGMRTGQAQRERELVVCSTGSDTGGWVCVVAGAGRQAINRPGSVLIVADTVIALHAPAFPATGHRRAESGPAATSPVMVRL